MPDNKENICASTVVPNIDIPESSSSRKRRFSTDVHNPNGTNCPKPKQLRLHQESATQLCLSLEEEKRREAMEKDFDSKLKIQGNSSSNGGESVQRSKSFAFRAPQENYSIHDFELGRVLSF
ncbi:hypothetical protein RIF29_16346 [Crotalaria pallida]|uniref:Uncharacterized protein n=1 Tax=Crotalaria pallida TaxID=3830 RepID=A0AAN9FF76_CROPI